MSIFRFAAAALMSLASAGAAQDIPLAPLGNYGKVAISGTQSGGGYIAFEQAFGGAFDAEPAVQYPETSELRRLGRAVGRLDVAFARGVGYCTAFVISEQHLMTNAHCLEGGQVQAISFITGYVESGVEAGTRIYTVGTAPVEISPSDELDYAILQVFGNPAADWGTLTLAAREIDEARDAGMPLLVMGHPVFQVAPVPVPQPLYLSRKECRATATRARAGNKLRHTCDTLVGNSGSPVFSDDTREVIALHHAGDPREGINFAIPMSLIARDSEIVAGLVALAPEPVDDLSALRAELDRLRAERDAARAAAEAEATRLAEKADRLAREKAEAARLAREKAEAERQKLADQLARLRAERDRLKAAAKTPPSAGSGPAASETDDTSGTGVIRIGLTLAPLNDDLRKALDLGRGAQGLAVVGVDPTSEAYEKGLRPGDVISEADHTSVQAIPGLDASLEHVRAVGRTSILLRVYRDGEPRFVALSPSPLPAPKAPGGAVPEAPDTGAVRLGLTLAPLNADLRKALDLGRDATGLAVVGVDAQSEAYAKGLRPGHVIVEVGQNDVQTITDFDANLTMSEAAGRISILLLVRRNGDPRFVALGLRDR